MAAASVLSLSTPASGGDSYERCLRQASADTAVYCESLESRASRCGHSHSHKPREAWRIGKAAWSRVDGARSSDRKRLRHVKRCSDPKRASRKWHNARERFAPVRKRKREARKARRVQQAQGCIPGVTVFIGAGQCWSIPYWCILRESGGRWSAHNPHSPARGAYQLLGHGEPWPVVTAADKREHHRIAGGLYASRGLQPWVAC